MSNAAARSLFSGFILNKATRARTIELAKEKTAEFRQMLFEELGEVDKCRYRTPEEVDMIEPSSN